MFDLMLKMTKTPSISAFDKIGGGVTLKVFLFSIIASLFITCLSGQTFAGTLTPTLGDDSAYTLTEVSTKDESTFKTYDYDFATGELIPKYYRIDLKTDKMTTSNNITWSKDSAGSTGSVEVKMPDGTTKTYYYTYNKTLEPSFTNTENITWSDSSAGSTGSVEVKMPDGTTKTYYYTYNKPADYTETSSAVPSISADAVTNKVFKNIETDTIIINNTTDNSSVNVKSDFVSNTVNMDSVIHGGGLIGNSNGSLGNIKASFVSNNVSARYIYGGGLIGNFSNSSDSSTIGDIAGNFISNTVKVLSTVLGETSLNDIFGGGLIGNYTDSSTIGNITGDFVSNNVTAKSICGGGLIGNCSGFSTSSIGNITGNFVSNNVTVESISGGGLIGNVNEMDDVESICSFSTGDITGNFISNTVTASWVTYGGGLIGNNGNCTIGNITGDFVSNTVISGDINGGGLVGNYYFSKIGDITGNFVSNKVAIDGDIIGGGLIGNDAELYEGRSSIGNITGDFISNIVTATNRIVGGGLIGNYAEWYIEVNAEFGDIKGNFVSNTVTTTEIDGGGLIGFYRNATVGNITGDFVSNTVNINDGGILGGGLIGVVACTTGNITGDFISNTVTANYIEGGGLIGLNETAEIKNITGDFVSNTVLVSSSSYSYIFGGGLIGNHGDASKIGDITGDFVSNTVTVKSIYGGGLIGNYSFSSASIIGDISGDFVSNIMNIENIYGAGMIGANNGSKIGNITGNFVSNNVSAKSIYGGGLIGNYASSSSSSTSLSQIGNIKGDFVSNTVTASGNGYSAGLISISSGAINNISGSFVSNKMVFNGITSSIYNGAIISIYTASSTIGSITADFVDNSIVSKSTKEENVLGIICNNGTITNGITNSTFKNNAVKLEAGKGYAGAIYTTTDLTINADNGTTLFSGNYTQVGNGEKDYNAIYVSKSNVDGVTPATLTLNATNNGVIQFDDNIKGVDGYKVKITGDSTGVVKIYNDIKNADITVDTVTVNTANNEIHEYEFKSLNSNENTKYSIDIDIDNKTADSFKVGDGSTGKITIDSLNFISGSFDNIGEPKDFVIQVIKSSNDNIQLDLSDNIKSQLPDTNYEIGRTTAILQDEVQEDTKWNDTYKQYTQDTVSYGKLGLAKTDTTNDSIGVSYDHSETEDKVFDKNLDTLAHVNRATNVSNKNFNFESAENIYQVSENLGETKGNLNINGVSDGEAFSTIDFNKKIGFVLKDETKLNITNINIENSTGSAINVENENATINLTNVNIKNNTGNAVSSNSDINLVADGKNIELSNNKGNAIYMNKANKTLTIDLKNNATLVQNSTISGSNDGYNLKLTGDNSSSIVINSNISNANISQENITSYISNPAVLNNNSLAINSGVMNINHMSLSPVHLANFSNNGTININSVDINPANETMGRFISDNYGVSAGAINVKALNVLSDPNPNKNVINIAFADSSIANTVKYSGSKEYMGKIFRYTVDYSPENGMFQFVKGGGSTNGVASLNPAILPATTSQQTGTYTTQLNTFNYVFQHADVFMNMPAMERMAYKNRNKYASTDFGVFSPLMTGEKNAGFWIKPYATFENVPLKNGPKINSISYGTLIGYDGEMKSLKYGWDRVITYYLGYNGASQNFAGNDSYQNGGLIGSTITLYKGNFFNATTISVGATVGENHTMFGTDYATSLFAGIGNKIGYNIEFYQGRFIIQPSMLMSYTFINTFDYKTASGVQINSDPTSMIQIAPTVRFIVNTKTGWQPYLAVGMVWNILAHSDIKANNVTLPNMYIKPYVQYGLGLQRIVKNRFTAFVQAMIYNAGRNGVTLSAGLRYSLGKDKLKTPEARMNSSKIIKE